MADAATPGMLATLVPVIVGGVIGFATGWFGPWLLEGRKEKAERKNRRADKFEELIAALYEHKHWLDIMERIWVYGFEEVRTMSPFAKVHAIARIYFTEFEAQIAALESASVAYEKWMYRAADSRVKGKPTIEGMSEAYGAYYDKFWSLQSELSEFSKKEFR